MSGIYFHIPFCEKKCIYCDFYSIETNANHKIDIMHSFISSLVKEISLRKDEVLKSKPNTIFIGGGTPNVLPLSLLEKILSVIYHTFYEPLDIVEYTIESNPEFITEDKLKLFSDYGINRISIGIQSFDDKALHILGRLSDSNKNLEAIEIIKKSDISELNCDMIYGLPEQNLNKLDNDIKMILKQNPQHISYYGLTIEKDTPLYALVKNDSISIPNDEIMADMYLMIIDRLTTNEYNIYEISNFAKNGHNSIHNLSYWNSEIYFGFGASATSYNGNSRFSNYFDVNKYIDSLGKNILPVGQTETLTNEQKIIEFIMLSLRKTSGLDLIKFRRLFNFSLFDLLDEKKPEILHNSELINYDNNFIHLTSKGFLVYDYIVSVIISLLG
jgi:oxygen-independent coproporphyrinogen III oxidase